ncbi:MAG: biopolymer transporter ExbD [Candidatus Delongbacteria bacterium]|nr:biopolymer transporter ExbD [Candidatus Delongbacteria bacterium]MBN2833761.1 biopolymer transporter ExbD [Candidatus Delongbacteria bacterium]
MLKNRERKAGEFNASSMADITFLLLVFFLVTTSISNDKGITFVLPEKMESQEEVKIKGVVNVVLNDEDGILLGTKGNEKNVELNEVKASLQQISQTEDLPLDTMIVSYKATKGASYNMYLSVLDQIKDAKIKKISLAQE